MTSAATTTDTSDEPFGPRADELLATMSLAEKAGMMFHAMVMMGPDGTLSEPRDGMSLPGTKDLLEDRFIRHVNIAGPITSVDDLVRWHNAAQEMALGSGSGIPLTVSSDPRHSFTENVGTAARAGVFSEWPESLGLAALSDPDRVYEFADIARQEYVAAGIRVSLHPQIDLATEPRWARMGATFGESAELTSDLVRAYVRGFQGTPFGATSVSTMTKHFPGGGPQLDGEDPHFAYGREQVYPGGRFDLHLEPFIAAIKAGTRQMMPYYGMPVDTEHEEVGFAFSQGIITDLLQDQLGFRGIVCTDWGLITDGVIFGQPMPARAWGVEQLSELERTAKLIEAGVDQFGGEHNPQLVIDLVESGTVSEARIDHSVRKLLIEKLALGLFDTPLLDPEPARQVVGQAEFVEAGLQAQRDSVVLLKNGTDGQPVLPLAADTRVYVEGIDPAVANGYFTVVADVADADVAVVRLKAPYEPRPGGFEALFHAGSLEFDPETLAHVASLGERLPTVVDVYLDRAAVLTELNASAAALTVTFGVRAEAYLDVLSGANPPRGRLPIDLPRSMAAVEASRSDVPFDTADPVYRFGDGLSY
ncbi:MAG: glycoside hydrolase family 3 N-terminal domain-containing protein [Propionibacteriaceae bacterium]